MCAKPDGMRRVQRSAAATQASLGPVRVADPRTTRRPTQQRRLLRRTSRRRFDVLGTKQLLRLQIPHRRNSQTRRNFLGFLRRPGVFPLLIPHHHLLLHLLPFSLPLLSHMQPHLLPSHVFLTSPLLHLVFFLLPIVLLDLIRHLFLSLLLLLNLFLLLLNIFLLLLLLLFCLCLCSLQLLLRSLQRLLRFRVSRHPHFRLFPKFCVLASLPSSMSPSRRKTIGRTFLRKSPKGWSKTRSRRFPGNSSSSSRRRSSRLRRGEENVIKGTFPPR